MKCSAWLIASLMLVPAAHAGDVYKWTDGQGVVHYGDKPPDAQVASKRLDVGVHALTEAEQKALAARLASDRARLTASAPTSGARPAATDIEKPAQSECARQWRAYNDNARCWDPQHRYNADRAAHPERYQYCTAPGHVFEVVAPTCPETTR